MQNADKIEEVKINLRRLRKLSRSIEVSLNVKERHERRLEHLLAEGKDEESEREAQKIKDNLSALRIDAWIKEATELESLYMKAISALEPLDRAIILDGYINGKAYWKVGKDIGYTTDGVKKRVGKIIEQIAKIVYGG